MTTRQYLDFAGLKPGDVVFDIGAYSGLTSIIFKELVGAAGTVAALEADEENLLAARKNLDLYSRSSGNEVVLLFGALWCHDNGVEFASHGNMGSSTTDLIGRNHGQITKVPSYTLMRLAQKLSVDRVDFIKCDIEGAEMFVFEDKEFFESYRPKIIVEPHIINGELSSAKVIEALSKYGYKVRAISQHGVSLDLLECYPENSESGHMD